MDDTNDNNKDSETGKIVLEVPMRLLEQLGESPIGRMRLALEALAIECYRTRTLADLQCASLLKMTDLEFSQFLRERRIPSNVPGEYFVMGLRGMMKHLSKK